MEDTNENYVITKEDKGWTVLFNSSKYGHHEDIEDLAIAMVIDDIEYEAISNPEAFSSNGIDYRYLWRWSWPLRKVKPS